MNCKRCGRTTRLEHSAVIGDVFYAVICSHCISESAQVSSGEARWNQTIDMEDHAQDVMQPHNADGTPNADFIHLYPEQAKGALTAEEISKAVRR